MSANPDALQKLIRAARKAPLASVPPEPSAPFGFSTRVAALWVAGRGRSGLSDAWERLCWWGAGVSVAVCVLAFVGQSLQPEPNPFDELIDAPATVLEVL